MRAPSKSVRAAGAAGGQGASGAAAGAKAAKVVSKARAEADDDADAADEPATAPDAAPAGDGGAPRGRRVTPSSGGGGGGGVAPVDADSCLGARVLRSFATGWFEGCVVSWRPCPKEGVLFMVHYPVDGDREEMDARMLAKARAAFARKAAERGEGGSGAKRPAPEKEAAPPGAAPAPGGAKGVTKAAKAAKEGPVKGKAAPKPQPQPDAGAPSPQAPTLEVATPLLGARVRMPALGGAAGTRDGTIFASGPLGPRIKAPKGEPKLLYTVLFDNGQRRAGLPPWELRKFVIALGDPADAAKIRDADPVSKLAMEPKKPAAKKGKKGAAKKAAPAKSGVAKPAARAAAKTAPAAKPKPAAKAAAAGAGKEDARAKLVGRRVALPGPPGLGARTGVVASSKRVNGVSYYFIDFDDGVERDGMRDEQVRPYVVDDAAAGAGAAQKGKQAAPTAGVKRGATDAPAGQPAAKAPRSEAPDAPAARGWPAAKAAAAAKQPAAVADADVAAFLRAMRPPLSAPGLAAALAALAGSELTRARLLALAGAPPSEEALAAVQDAAAKLHLADLRDCMSFTMALQGLKPEAEAAAAAEAAKDSEIVDRGVQAALKAIGADD